MTSGSSPDVVVIGAGPAGIAAATYLRRAGHEVCVYEREVFPRFVIGESLLPRCMDLLEELGLLDAVARQGYQEKTGATFIRRGERCTFDFAEQRGGGWARTWQVPRAHFDGVLAEAAQAQGVRVRFGHEVTGVQVGVAPEVTVRGHDGAERAVACRFVVDASGYGRVLPRLLGLDAPSTLPRRASIFTHARDVGRPPSPEAERIWIVSHHGGWIWVIPFADGTASVGVVARPEELARYPEDPAERLRAVLRAEPATAARLAEAPFRFPPRTIEGYSIGVTRLHGRGYCLVGNATEFLDPVFSSGVTLALESAVLAAKATDRALRGEAVDWDADYAAPLTHAVEVFRSYVGWWYDGTLPRIFFAPNPDPEVKRAICSVLAGYVLDRDNPYVSERGRKVPQLARVLA